MVVSLREFIFVTVGSVVLSLAVLAALWPWARRPRRLTVIALTTAVGIVVWNLALNSINWLSSDEDLISIRPKEQDDRRITLTKSQMTWVRTISQFVLPLIVVVGGVGVWWRRR